MTSAQYTALKPGDWVVNIHPAYNNPRLPGDNKQYEVGCVHDNRFWLKKGQSSGDTCLTHNSEFVCDPQYWEPVSTQKAQKPARLLSEGGWRIVEGNTKPFEEGDTVVNTKECSRTTTGVVYTVQKVDGELKIESCTCTQTWLRVEPVKAEEKRKKKLTLDKLIIPEEDKQAILAVINQHSHSSLIFDSWGLGETIEYGKGMGLLFWGGPGTGKTFGALQIAKALEKELHIVSPAEIQSQEPGGANRAIVEAFKIAKDKKRVLFFDECDGLVMDRTHLGPILAGEVNSLLTELEKFEGVAIFATNRAEHLDPAMERRLALILEFKLPTKEQRLEIWKNLIPKKMPLEGVELEKLAEFALSGGQIKNVVLGAARIAANLNKRKVHDVHFAEAIKRVYAGKGVLGTYQGQKGRSDLSKSRA